MTNRAGILKSKDNTLPAEVRIVKAVVFLVVMYGCESWAIKKAEHWRTEQLGDWTTAIKHFIIKCDANCGFSIGALYSIVGVFSISRFVVVQSLSCVQLCNPMECSTPGFPVLHHLPELAQTCVHWFTDTIQPSHPLSSPSPPAFNLSQQIRVFSNESALCIRWPKY